MRDEATGLQAVRLDRHARRGSPGTTVATSRIAACVESWVMSVRVGQEHRGAARGSEAARIPRLRLGRCRRRSTPTARSACRKKAGKLQMLVDDLEASPLTERHHRHRAHPLGDPRRPDRRERAPAPRRRRQARADPQRHHRELLRAQGRARSPRASSSPARPTPRSPRTSSPAPTARSGDLTEALRAVVNTPRRRVHAARRARRPARRRRRRPPQLARSSSVSATARTSSARDVAAFVEYTRRAMSIGQDQLVTIRPDSVDVVDFDGNPVEASEFEVDLGRLGRREGRLVQLHGERDQRGARGRREDAARPRRRRRRHPDRPRRRSASVCSRSTASSSSRAARPPTPASSASTRSSSGPACPSRSSSRTSSATATRCSTSTPSSCRSASRARRWTR